MAHIDSNELDGGLALARQNARQAGYVQHAQLMLVAAGIAAAGIVVVVAAMMTTLL